MKWHRSSCLFDVRLRPHRHFIRGKTLGTDKKKVAINRWSLIFLGDILSARCRIKEISTTTVFHYESSFFILFAQLQFSSFLLTTFFIATYNSLFYSNFRLFFAFHYYLSPIKKLNDKMRQLHFFFQNLSNFKIYKNLHSYGEILMSIRIIFYFYYLNFNFKVVTDIASSPSKRISRAQKDI